MKIYQILTAITLLSLSALASAQPSLLSRYTVINNGSEVQDNRTGLIWQRCTQGMVVTSDLSNCEGTPSLVLHEDALRIATELSANGWRLPNLKELSSIVNRASNSTTIDTVVFPSNPQGNLDFFWSSTPDTTTGGRVLTISFNTDKVGVNSLLRSDNNSGEVFTGLVRLVRTLN